MDKEGVVCIYNGILLSHKKNEILPFATTWMDLEGIMLCETSQTETDKYCITSLMCGVQKIKQMNVYDKTETDSQIQRTNHWLLVGRRKDGGAK